MPEIETRVAVLEAVVPRIEGMLTAHMSRTEELHRQAEEARAKVSKGLDCLAKTIAADENQRKGAVWATRIGWLVIITVGPALTFFGFKLGIIPVR